MPGYPGTNESIRRERNWSFLPFSINVERIGPEKVDVIRTRTKRYKERVKYQDW
jgi:hypothetical protein